MRVMIVGASGLIGSAVVARLRAEGHEVVAVARRVGRPGPGLRWVRLDLRTATTPEAWRPHLAGIDAVVNCAGVLQDNGADSTRAAHVDGPAALYAACATAEVARVILVSAVGADRETPSAFSATKAQGEAALMATGLAWVILRPAIVVGAPAYGGSALFRGLAALPVALQVPGGGPLQVVLLDDVVATIVWCLGPDVPPRLQVDLAAPRHYTFEAIVAAYRGWLGWEPARSLRAPAWLMSAVFRAGDLAGRLGWRSPMRSTAQTELRRGAVGDPTRWMEITGLRPRDLATFFVAQPASVQERWFARLYLLKPVVLLALAALWIGTALVSLGPGADTGLDLMRRAGVTGSTAVATVVAGALADLVIGLGLMVRRTARAALLAGVGLSLSYALVGTVLLPGLWLDPLGPLLKIAPIVALHLVALAILEDR